MSFPRYPKYKPSGVEWLGDVPEHWSLPKVRSVASFSGGGTPSRENLGYWRGDIPWVSPKDMKRELITGAEEFITDEGLRSSACSMVPPGTLLMVVRSGILQHTIPVAINDVPVALNQDMKALRFEAGWCRPEFFLRWVQGLNDLLLLAWAKQGATVESIEHGYLANTVVPLPSLDEQSRIAAFLDRETAKIDALVAAQQRLIELLKEKRQAVISHAVTKGLNSNAPMKPSGIEWLGDVPEHWRVVPLGRLAISRCDGPFGSGLKSEHYTETGVRVIRLQNIRAEGFDGTDAAFIDEGYYERELPGHDVVAADVLIAGLGDDNNLVGRACVAPCGIEPAMVKADCFRFRVDRDSAVPAFVAAALSLSAEADAGRLATGSTRSRIPLSRMATRMLPIPDLPEQRLIVKVIDAESARLEMLTAEAQRAIDLLRERRTALISAAVTGQIDVRSSLQQATA